MTNEKAKLIRVLKSNKALFRGADVSATQFLRLVDALLDSGVTVRDYSEKNEPVDGNAIREQESNCPEIEAIKGVEIDQVKTGWIPVAERLPDVGMVVLVYSEDGLPGNRYHQCQSRPALLAGETGERLPKLRATGDVPRASGAKEAAGRRAPNYGGG